MSRVQLLLLALALSADAFAVSVCRARGIRSALTMAAAFGFFQAVMPVGGWFGGSLIRNVLAEAAPWAAFAILTAVGGRMFWQALKNRGNVSCETGRGMLLSLAFATSLDAFAAGVSLSLVGTPVWLPAAIIGAVTFGVCLVGAGIGTAAGRRLGSLLETGAGLVIIALGVKALF
jgi:putative Mn2+ efflux pump MntP